MMMMLRMLMMPVSDDAGDVGGDDADNAGDDDATF